MNRNYPHRDDLPYVEPPPRMVRYYRHVSGQYGISRRTVCAHVSTLSQFVIVDSELVAPNGTTLFTHRSGVTAKVLAACHREVYTTPEQVKEWMTTNLAMCAAEDHARMLSKGWQTAEPEAL